MKRRLTTAALMIAAFVLCFGMTAVYAEEMDLGSIEQPKEMQIDEKEYMEHAALVMFTTSKKLTKKKAKTLLTTGKSPIGDVTIDGLWSFRSSDKDLVSGSSGMKKILRQDSGGAGFRGVALVRSRTLSTKELIRKMSMRSDVLYAEPNYKIRAASVSKDTYSDYQWSMQDGDQAANVAFAWGKGNSGSDNIVAVLDSGVDYTHPDLAKNMWENDHYPTLKGECGYDFINGDDDPMDDNGHGTHCAGIIGAVGDNNLGISGVNKKIRIMALKILDYEGTAWMSHEIEAYNYIDKALDLKEPVRAINNSWGGGEESLIFSELVDIVGEKGAVSVFAAGNEGSDNDREPAYPSNIDSPYKVTVAATNYDGSLAGYSNYGDETVDVAAPGSTILSTVNYNSYNPSIYGSKQGQISASYNDFEGTNTWGVFGSDPSVDDIFLNGKPFRAAGAGDSGAPGGDPGDSGAPGGDPSGARISVDTAGPGLIGQGRGMKLTLENMAEGDLACFTIPYEISHSAKLEPTLSLMATASGPKGASDIFGGSLFGITEVPQGTDLDVETLGDKELIGSYIDDESNIWIHHELTCPVGEDMDDVIRASKKASDGEPDPCKREIVLLVWAEKAGDYTIRIDDLGMSRQDLSSENAFGKYDYQSGTSMSAPFISGAIALKAKELGKNADPETIINETVSMARTAPVLPVAQGGGFDFTKRPAQLPPRIGKVTVDRSKNTVIIHGSGLNPSTGVKVEIGNDEKSLKTVTPISKADRKITVKNSAMINNLKTVKVTGYQGKEFMRRDVYLVEGKKTFSQVTDGIETPTGGMATDGKLIYWTDSTNRAICSLNPANPGEGAELLCIVDPTRLFKSGTKKNAEYGMAFGKDLACTGGSLYAVVEYGMSQTPEGDSTSWTGQSKGNAGADSGFIIEFGEESGGGEESIYSGDLRLIGTYRDEEGETRVANLGPLPSELLKTADWTMTSYNGKLYFLGGYSYIKGKKGLTGRVKVYDPKSKKWSSAKGLPEPRAGGKAIQSGNKLIYTLGYSSAMAGKDPVDQRYPVNLIFDGKKWKKSSVKPSVSLDPLVIERTVTRKGKQYITSEASLGLTRGGIVYTGMPAAHYGDAFTYSAGKDRFADTGYNYITDIDAAEMRGIAVGGSLYGFEDSKMYRMPVASGLVRVTTSKGKGGSVSGAGSYMPGETVRAAVSSAKNYKIDSLKVNGKAVKLKKNTVNRTVSLPNISADQKVEAKFKKYKAQVTVKTKGKGSVKGAGSYLLGKKVKLRVKAKKGWYIKSIKVGKKKIKLKKNAKKKTVVIKKIKKDTKVKVVFKKIKKKK